MSSAPTTRRSTTTRKQLPFGESEPGATGLELLLPLTLKWAAEESCRSCGRWPRITSAPAAVLGCRAGSLAVGEVADLCVFDPDAHWMVAPGDAGEPGQEHAVPRASSCRAGCATTLVGGRVVFER